MVHQPGPGTSSGHFWRPVSRGVSTRLPARTGRDPAGGAYAFIAAKPSPHPADGNRPLPDDDEAVSLTRVEGVKTGSIIHAYLDGHQLQADSVAEIATYLQLLSVEDRGLASVDKLNQLRAQPRCAAVAAARPT